MDTWMGDRLKALRDRRLCDLVLPGTHDSAAFQLMSPSPLPVKHVKDRVIAFVARWFPKLVAGFTLAQHLTIAEQLSAGVRFLDLRVSLAANGDFVLTHTFACVPLSEVLQQTVAFLAEKCSEVVLVSLSADWEHREAFAEQGVTSRALELVSGVCFDHLFPPPCACESPDLPTLGAMVDRGRRLMVFSHLPQPESKSNPHKPLTTQPGKALVWPGAYNWSLWANSDTPVGTVEGLLRMVAEQRSSGLLPPATDATPGHAKEDPAPPTPPPPPPSQQPAVWHLSVAVTPSVASITRSILLDPRHAGLRSLAARLEALLPRLLGEGLAGVTGLCLDHPSPEAVAAVVGLNDGPRWACAGPEGARAGSEGAHGDGGRAGGGREAGGGGEGRVGCGCCG
ncbi:hypothetical protein HYH03_015316 [Edaphochlamys debaryana]|uniref:Phosphatidylinositol-specific phospholipase C X domain-containing protein n=1 Tax=Edaphochlamys debaryana TaxID=47281 RepID=A0A836BSN0_9CHLO|nr:hypothetical protein HYH03_015316 [Edaphochlamys debaryana]|eukprot:KAG2485994.1 hypothetical protein HYH03_015316 [Edaphochlamys debaryana]